MSNPNYINQQKEQRPSLGAHDSTLVFIVFFLIIIGFLAIFSAGAPKCTMENLPPTNYVFKQLQWFVLGCVFMFGLRNVSYKLLDKFSIPLAWVIIGLLVCVELFGNTVNGATRWISFGPINFQPSEIAKLGVVALLASAFSKSVNIKDIRIWKNYFLPIAIMIFLILKQPNLSMVMILSISSLYMYFSAGGNIRYIVSCITVGALALPFIIQGYQKERVDMWLHPEKDPFGAGYNIIQAMMAFVAGGFFGVGYGNSRQKLGWLPEGHTDFIFAVFAEEFGFLGCLLIIGLFIAFLQRGLLISAKCDDVFGKLLAAGITVSICIQAMINMCVASSLIPATGVPLPFISYGGTSLFMTMCMVGVLLNISRKQIKRFPNVKKQ
jgi:cell division protein FtsW